MTGHDYWQRGPDNNSLVTSSDEYVVLGISVSSSSSITQTGYDSMKKLNNSKVIVRDTCKQYQDV
jgi:hypothetical protein